MSTTINDENNNNNNNNNTISSQNNHHHHIHGLALTIRSSTESGTYDFGGLPSTTVTQIIKDAFSKPFPPLLLQQQQNMMMIRITLIVGGGKQCRQKYDPQCLKLVTSALQATNQYIEDKGASCIIECAGSYKVQHDTGKNVKTVVIFPNISTSSGGDDPKDGSSSTDGTTSFQSNTTTTTTTTTLLPPNSIQYTVATSSMAIFTNMIKFRFPTWVQKRALIQLIDDTITLPLKECDTDLVNGKPLSPDRQLFYDMCTRIDDKKTYVRDEMHKQVENGNLTQYEVDILLSQIQTKIDEIGSIGGGGSRNDNNTNTNPVLKKALERKAKLQNMVPIPPAPLKHHATLGGLWKQVAPLLYLNNQQGGGGGGGGKLLSVQETKKLGQLNELLSQINDLETDSRGWLEDDDTFNARVKAYRIGLQQKYGNKVGMATSSKNNNNKKGGTGGNKMGGSSKTKGGSNSFGGKTINATTRIQMPTTVGGNGWMSADQKKELAMKKKKARMVKGDVFGAMMADHDSGSDDDDDNNDGPNADNDDDQQGGSPSIGLEAGNINNSDATSGPTKRKNKKKKQKAKGDSNDDDAVLEKAYSESIAATKALLKEEERAKSEQTTLMAMVSFLQMYILPFITGLLGWILSILFGSSKTKKNGSTTKSNNSRKKN